MKKLPILFMLSLIGGTTHLALSQVTMQPEADNPDLVKVYVKQDPATYQKTTTQTNQVDFAVQVAASSKPIAESAAKKEWDAMGNVYVQKENGLYKIRIGPFATQTEAKDVLLQVKSKGTKDAFIVVLQDQANDKSTSQPQTTKKSTSQAEAVKTTTVQPVTVKKATSAESQEKKAVVKTETTKSEPQEKKAVVKPETTKATEITSDMPMPEYKVRVASYQKPGSFNPNGIEKLGKLESYRKGDMTIMMIGGFKNLQDAQKAKDIVLSKGYKEAAVVVDRDGILEEVVAK